jgi:hypothetical protein
MALVIFPDLMQRVQIFMVFTEPFITTRNFLIFGFQRRRVLLLAWLTLLPNWGFFSQTLHFIDIHNDYSNPLAPLRRLC